MSVYVIFMIHFEHVDDGRFMSVHVSDGDELCARPRFSAVFVRAKRGGGVIIVVRLINVPRRIELMLIMVRPSYYRISFSCLIGLGFVFRLIEIASRLCEILLSCFSLVF